MGKKLTEDFVNRLGEKLKRLKSEQKLSKEAESFFDEVKLFIEDFYSEMESFQTKEKLLTAIIIVGSIVLALIKL
jgi:hypothetical protein